RCVALLVRRIVRNFRLIKVRPPMFALPQDLELLMMLDEQPISGHIVPVHYQSVVAQVARPPHSRPVICPPNPRMVDNSVVRIDLQIHLRSPSSRSPVPEEHIMQKYRIARMRSATAF